VLELETTEEEYRMQAKLYQGLAESCEAKARKAKNLMAKQAPKNRKATHNWIARNWNCQHNRLSPSGKPSPRCPPFRETDPLAAVPDCGRETAIVALNQSRRGAIR
jgi:hypothetical protein